MSVKSGGRIRERLFGDQGDQRSRLVVTPVLVPASQIKEGDASIDLRLGMRFTVYRRGKLGEVDTNDQKFDDLMAAAQQNYYTPIGSWFVLHPDYFVLGESLEYIRMPDDLMGYVVTRSSWGRHGLVIATAIGVHPGYRGVLTLELRNLADVPLRLYPGQRILQLFLHDVDTLPKEGRAMVPSHEGETHLSPGLIARDQREVEAIGRFGDWDNHPLL